MLEKEIFNDLLAYSNKATFHVSGKINKHNTRIRETEHPHTILQYVRDSPKMNVFCALSKKCVEGLFALNEQRSTAKRAFL